MCIVCSQYFQLNISDEKNDAHLYAQNVAKLMSRETGIPLVDKTALEYLQEIDDMRDKCQVRHTRLLGCIPVVSEWGPGLLGFSTAWATSCLNMNFMKYFTYCIICVIFPDLPPPPCSKLQHPITELTKIWLTLEYETLQTSNDLMDPWQVITLLICVFII